MGAEHSSTGNSHSSRSSKQLQQVKPGDDSDAYEGSDGSRPGSISPGPSICSDSDLPYISYTVNRPIGDSPKLPQKHSSQLQRGKSLAGNSFGKKSFVATRRQFSVGNKSLTHNIVVVKPGVKKEPEKDPDLIRLQNVPMFLPIMRGTLNLPAVRDPEVLERLDPGGFLSLCLRYQQHLAVCAEVVGSEQTQLGNRIRDIDFELSRSLTVMTERQKKFAKYAEKLSKVHEISHQLNKCHMLLNQTLESMETLNDYLPVQDRLEPFIWTTG